MRFCVCSRDSSKCLALGLIHQKPELYLAGHEGQYVEEMVALSGFPKRHAPVRYLGLTLIFLEDQVMKDRKPPVGKVTS